MHELGTSSQPTTSKKIYGEAWSLGCHDAQIIKDTTWEQLEVYAAQGWTIILNLQTNQACYPADEYTIDNTEWEIWDTLKNDPTDNYQHELEQYAEKLAQNYYQDWSKTWGAEHYVVLVSISNDGLLVMDPRLPCRYGTISKDDFLDRWHSLGEIVEETQERTQENHIAIVFRGMDVYNPKEYISIR